MLFIKYGCLWSRRRDLNAKRDFLKAPKRGEKGGFCPPKRRFGRVFHFTAQFTTRVKFFPQNY